MKQVEGYTVSLILLTHTHFDHFLAAYGVKEATGAPFRMHEDGLQQLSRMEEWMQTYGLDITDPFPEVDSYIEAGEIIEAEGARLEARFTPGHSPGHLTFVMHEQGIAFVGDCIFFDSYGNTSLPGGNTALLKESIETQILTLPDSTRLLPGHGPATTVGREKQSSLALAELLRSH